MGIEIFKIEEEMTEKIRPKVANPHPKIGRIHYSQYALHYCPSAFLWPAMRAKLVPYVGRR